MVYEDLQWADSFTLELINLILDQVPTLHVLTILTARPEFHLPWVPRSYLTCLSLDRLSQSQTEEMVGHLMKGEIVPAEFLQQIVSKADGVPLFVEELAKMLIKSDYPESGKMQDILPISAQLLTIPPTLQDLLMARLDQLGIGKIVVQIGAIIGQQFSYEQLQEMTSMDETMLQQELGQLVKTELLYQQGIPPNCTYRFKYTLIREAAYQSLLRSTRHQYQEYIM